MLITHRAVTCPHCWESIELALDLSVPMQEYVEDCTVCCRPMVVRYSADDGELIEVAVTSEDGG